MPLILKYLQHLGKQNELPRRLDQPLNLVSSAGPHLRLFGRYRKQVRMVAALLQIHHDVEQRHGLPAALRVQRLVVARQNVLVVLLLHRRQLDAHDELRLGRHVLEHVGLESPQHVGPEQLVQLLHLILLGDVGELVLEHRQVVELLLVEEVEQMEQFLEVVLQRGAGQEEFVRDVVASQHFKELRNK